MLEMASKTKAAAAPVEAPKRFDVVLDGVPYLVDLDRRVVLKNNVCLHTMAATAILNRLRAAGKLDSPKKANRS